MEISHSISFWKSSNGDDVSVNVIISYSDSTATLLTFEVDSTDFVYQTLDLTQLSAGKIITKITFNAGNTIFVDDVSMLTMG